MLRRWLFRIALGVVVLVAILLVWRLNTPPPSHPPPVQISLASTNNPLSVSPGGAGILFVLPDGSLWRWGNAGMKDWAAVPQRLEEESDWRQAVAGNNGFVATKQNGTLWQFGLLGGTLIPEPAPKQIGTDRHWSFVTRVNAAAAVLKTDGTLWTWGDSLGTGTLGDPAVSMRSAPGQVGTNRWQWIMAAGSYAGFLGLTQEGALHAWGQFLPQTPALSEPTPVLADRTWLAAEEDGWTHLVLDSARTLWTSPLDWDAGFPGTNNLTQIRSNAVSGRFAIALSKLYEIREDGTLWAEPIPVFLPWARSPSGTAAQVGDRTDWIRLWCGSGTCIGLTQDGTVWAWGKDWGAGPQRDTLSQLQKRLNNGIGSFLRWIGIPRFAPASAMAEIIRIDETPFPILKMNWSPSPEGSTP